MNRRTTRICNLDFQDFRGMPGFPVPLLLTRGVIVVHQCVHCDTMFQLRDTLNNTTMQTFTHTHTHTHTHTLTHTVTVDTQQNAQEVSFSLFDKVI